MKAVRQLALVFGQVTARATRKAEMPASESGPLGQIRVEWMRRIEAEYTSAAHAHNLTHWCIQLGFPRELIDDGLRIVQDELDHAQLSAAVYRESGGVERPRLLADQLALPRLHQELSHDALLSTVELFCLGETVAVPLFKELRSECTVPVAREALDRILRDEVRHRAFGWDCLDYFLESEPALARLVSSTLTGLFAKVVRLYGVVPRQEVAIDPELRAWGLMPRALYRAILLEVGSSEYVPAFEERGISAQKAWDLAVSRLPE